MPKTAKDAGWLVLIGVFLMVITALGAHPGVAFIGALMALFGAVTGIILWSKSLPAHSDR